jgi:hypothetical protein
MKSNDGIGFCVAEPNRQVFPMKHTTSYSTENPETSKRPPFLLTMSQFRKYDVWSGGGGGTHTVTYVYDALHVVSHASLFSRNSRREGTHLHEPNVLP